MQWLRRRRRMVWTWVVCVSVLLAAVVPVGALNGNVPETARLEPPQATAGAVGDSWPQVQKDASHSGYVTQTVTAPYTELWRRDLFPVSSRVQPVIADGLIFLPSNDKSLYALNTSNGQTVWSYPTGGALVNSAAYANGRVFVGSTDRFVYAVRSTDGAFLWRYPTGNTVKTAPLVADGKVFIGSSDGYMYALDQATGSLVWRISIGAPIYDTAAYDGGQVFFGGMNSVGYALNATTGAVVWSRAIPGQGFRDRWTVAGNGKVFFTPMLYGSHHEPLSDGTYLFHADANPVLYNQPWSVQRQAILNYLSSNPYRQPMHVLNQTSGTTAFTPPILYASGGSASPHAQPVLLPNGNANVIYRRSFGEPAQYGATTDDALYTGELNLTTGDITPIDSCAQGTGGWNNCGTYKSPIISDESAGLARSGQILYVDTGRGTAGLDLANRILRPFAAYDPSAGWPFYGAPVILYPGQVGWVVDYQNLKSEVDSDGNDLKRPTPIVGDTFYILHYNRLVAVKGTLRSSAQQAAPGSLQRLEVPSVSQSSSDLPSPSVATAGVQDMRQELEARVKEMVDLGHMAPTFYFIGLSGQPRVYYTTPAETLYTLSAAFPYLSDALKAKVKQFLDAEIRIYPPHQQGCYAPVTGKLADLVGARREVYVPDPNRAFNYWPGAGVHPAVLYAIWLYSNNTGDWTYATNQYTALKSIYSSLRNTGAIKSYPELSGAIGFARIAQHLGRTSDVADASAFVSSGYIQGVNFSQFLATAQSRYVTSDMGYTTPVFFSNVQGYNATVALHFNRDIGSFLAGNAVPAVLSYTDQISKAVPLWWLTAPAFSHGENSYAPPEISWTNFMLHAYVLKDSTETLKSYLDAPDRKGDLFYMQKLVAVIHSLPTLDVSRSAKSASTSMPRTGQVMTYTIVLRNDGDKLTDTVYMTDTLPADLTYVPRSLKATGGSPADSSAPTLRWSGVLSGTPIVTLTYAVTVTTPASSSRVVTNIATIDAGAAGMLTRDVVVIVNPKAVYLPLVLRSANQ